MPGIKDDVLLVRCSDGRSQTPDHIRKDLVHEFRAPGGPLFSDFCAHSISIRGSEQTFVMSTPIDVEIQTKINLLISLLTPETGQLIGELVMLLVIKTMVDLKKPKGIILVYHSYCGAADAIGLSELEVRAKLQALRGKLSLFYPTIEVTVLKETHSECGEHHHGHEQVCSVVTEAMQALAA
jgi:hypothetical protein